MSTITDAAQALTGLLRAAEDGDLPLPTSAEATAYPPYDRDDLTDVGQILILVRSLADLTAWATWLDEPIDDTAKPYRGNIHCHVRGMAGPVPVTVTSLVPIAQAVSA